MARVKRAVNAQKKRRTLLETASGYRGQRSRLYRKAKEQMLHSMQYAYRDRRDRKGDFRQLWITRINAAARANGMTYNRLIQGLRLAGIEVDRKILADLAVNDATAFAGIVEVAKAAVAAEGTGGRRRPPERGLDILQRPGVAPFTDTDAPGRRCPAAAAPPRPRPDRAVPGRGPAGGPGGRWPPARSRAVRYRRGLAGTPTPCRATPTPVDRSPTRRSPRWPRPSPRRASSPSASSSTCRSPTRCDRAPRLVAVLAEIRDPGNAGTVLRTADAAGAGRGGVRRRRRRPVQRQVRAGLAPAACSTSTWSATATRAAVVAALRAAGLHGARRRRLRRTDLDDFADAAAGRADRLAVRLRGARPARRRCWPPPTPGCGCRIHGRAESLNLAAAAAVCLYASARRLRPLTARPAPDACVPHRCGRRGMST